MQQQFEVNNSIWQNDLDILAQDKIFEEYKNSTLFITGATGLIGSELIFSCLSANRLNKYNIKVIGLARNEEKAKKIFANVISNPNFKLIIQDITLPIRCEEKIDYIIHCANITSSKEMIEKPVDTSLTTIIGTKNVLDFAKEKNIKNIVYISSIEMYGKTEKEDIKEEDYGIIDTQNIRNCYPLSKKMAENLCFSYALQYGLNTKIARLTQTLGAGISPNDNRVFAQFAKSIIKNEDIILHTDGESYKNYCYITDAISGILTILKYGDGIYNVANYESGISIKDLALMLINEYKTSNLKFEINENKGYAQKIHIKLNPEKLQNLGWQPKNNLKEMFDKLIKYLKEEGI